MIMPTAYESCDRQAMRNASPSFGTRADTRASSLWF